MNQSTNNHTKLTLWRALFHGTKGPLGAIIDYTALPFNNFNIRPTTLKTKASKHRVSACLITFMTFSTSHEYNEN